MTRPLAVTFDFWDTLVRAPTSKATRSARRERLLGVLRDGGAVVDPAALDAVLAQVRTRFDQLWEANEQFTGLDATSLMLELLDVPFDDAHREALERSFMGLDSDHVPDLTPNIEPVLRRLRAEGIGLGIICDVGLSPSSLLRSYLEHHGVLGLFDHWSFSDEVGVYKPDPVIFEHALHGLGGVEPAQAAHVGDLRRTDVAGAAAFGMTAVRYAGTNDDRPRDGVGVDAAGRPAGESGAGPTVAMAHSANEFADADHVITDHEELLAVLGI